MDKGASDKSDRATAAEPVVSALRDGVPSAARKVKQDFRLAEEPYGHTFSPGAGMLRLCSHGTSRNETWWSGDFVDYRGIVSVIREANFLRLDAVAGGRCHVRSWLCCCNDTTVAKLCRAFLTDLHGEPTPIDEARNG